MLQSRITLLILVLLSETENGSQNIAEQIYQGVPGSSKEFPYLARLYNLEKVISPTCTGSLVKQDLILTAGHCCGFSGTSYAVFGNPDHKEFFVQARKSGQLEVPGYSAYQIKEEYIHPNYEEREFTIMHDVCLVRLEQAINESEQNQIAQISFNRIHVRECTAVGWGNTEKETTQFKLYKKTVFAEASWRGNWLIRLYFHAICQGDSGGPLLCGGKIYGVASFSTTYRCSVPGVDYYAYLHEEADFIGQYVSAGNRVTVVLSLSSLAIVLLAG